MSWLRYQVARVYLLAGLLVTGYWLERWWSKDGD